MQHSVAIYVLCSQSRSSTTGILPTMKTSCNQLKVKLQHTPCLALPSTSLGSGLETVSYSICTHCKYIAAKSGCSSSTTLLQTPPHVQQCNVQKAILFLAKEHVILCF